MKVDPVALRPALKAIILALLPGLEEESSEDFERTLKIVNGFKNVVRTGGITHDGVSESSGDEYFWQCFLLASITSNNRRLGALSYLTRHLPKLGGLVPKNATVSGINGTISDDLMESQRNAAMVTSPEPGLLLRCFAAGLADDQILIQRGFLDLLVTHLPLHARVLQTRVKSDDLVLLMTAASAVVSRRDMSLNRRLWTWLLGPESAGGADGEGPESPSSVSPDPMSEVMSSRTQYFEEYGLQALTRALLRMIMKDQKSAVERARPYRICLSLMDRWEIGGLVVPEIFLPVVKSVQQFEAVSDDREAFKEVLRSASVFFDGVESGLIWGEVLGLLAESLGPHKISIDVRIEKLHLVRFILANFNVREEEMLILHAPTTALAVIAMIRESPSIGEDHSNQRQQVSSLAVTIANDLVDLIPSRAYLSKALSSSKAEALAMLRNSEILQKIRKFYVNDQGNLDVSEAPFSPTEISYLISREAGKLASQSLGNALSSADVAARTQVIVTLLSKIPNTTFTNMEDLLNAVQSALAGPTVPSFSVFTSIALLIGTLFVHSYISVDAVSVLVDPMTKVAWFYLSPSFPKYHVETAKILLQLQISLSLTNHDLEAAICDQMLKSSGNSSTTRGGADPGRRFVILWTHLATDNAGHHDRRGSKSSFLESKQSSSELNIFPYQIMLSRPLFLFLDALSNEQTQLFIVARDWLQNLPGTDK